MKSLDLVEYDDPPTVLKNQTTFQPPNIQKEKENINHTVNTHKPFYIQNRIKHNVTHSHTWTASPGSFEPIPRACSTSEAQQSAAAARGIYSHILGSVAASCWPASGLPWQPLTRSISSKSRRQLVPPPTLGPRDFPRVLGYPSLPPPCRPGVSVGRRGVLFLPWNRARGDSDCEMV